MQVKIATWNMDYWKREKQPRKAAWEYLDEIIAPDIALVQEAAPISKYMGFIGTGNKPSGSLIGNETVLWQEIGGGRNWGSGVLTKNFPLRQVYFNNSFQGSVMAAEVLLPDKSLLTVISLYGLIVNGYSTTTLHTILSDLTILLNKSKRVIIGGDFNASLQYDEKYSGQYPSHRMFFERLLDFGLVNCIEKFHPEPIQTIRHSNSEFPWQNDYIFASKGIIGMLQSCDVIDNTQVHEFSDHNPVVATFEFNRAPL